MLNEQLTQGEVEAAEILTAMAVQIDETIGTFDNNNIINVESLSPAEITQSMITNFIAATKNYANTFISRSKNVAKLASEAHGESSNLIQKLGLVLIKGAREYINTFKETARITAEVLKQDALIGSSTIYDMVLKGVAAAEGISQQVGYSQSIDNIINQHETIIYITLQKESLEILGNDYISPSMEKSEINDLLDAILNDNRFFDMHNKINSHIIRAAQLFFFSKMGTSAVSNLNSIKATLAGEGIASGISNTVDNSDIVQKYNIDQIRQHIISLTSGQERKHILSNIISDIHSGNQNNHSKYFGMPYNVDEFINYVIGNEGFLTAELNQQISSVDNSVTYYIENILGKLKKRDGSTSSGESIKPNGILYNRVSKLQSKIDETFEDVSDYVNQQYKTNFKDFGGTNDKTTQLHKLESIVYDRKESLHARIVNIMKRMNNALSTQQGMETIDGGSKRKKGKHTRVSKNKKGRNYRNTKRKNSKKIKNKVSHKKTNRKRGMKHASRKK